MSSPLTISRATLQLRATRGFSVEYIIHQLVADLFGDRKDRGYLYRITNQNHEIAQVLTLSDDPPSENPPTRDWGGLVRIESKPFQPDFSTGMVLDYEIFLNATQVVTDTTGEKKRKDVWDAIFGADRNDRRSPDDAYREYLSRRLDGAAEILDTRVTKRGQIRAKRADQPRPITFIATNLIGTLRVEDADGFAGIVATGIGRSKAFGCGLLCLSRPGSILPRRHSPHLDR